MKHLLRTGLAGLLLTLGLPLASRAQSSILDPTFGTNGRVLTTFTSGLTTDQAQSVALQPDGKLVVAGYGGAGLEVARYTPAGALDATFGYGGQFSVEFGPIPSVLCTSASCTQEQSKALAVYVQADGRLVLGGRRSGQWLATRLLPNGQLDGSFVTPGGTYTLLAGTQGGEISRIGQQSGGQVILIGRTSSLNAFYPRVVRVLASGAVDATFTGTVPSNGSTFSSFDGLVDDADRTVLLGYETFPFTPAQAPQLVAYRFLPGGQLDPAFGTAGRVALPAAFTGYSGGGALVPLPTGQLLVVAASSAGVNVARLQADGTPDPSFGTGGVATNPGLAIGQFKRARLQPDGKLLVACLSPLAAAQVPVSATNSTATSVTDFTLARFLASGQLDTSYGVGGMVRIHEDNLDNLTDLTVQADGKAVAVGAAAAGSLYRPATYDYALQNSRFAVLRVLPTANCTTAGAGAEQTICGATTLRLGPAPQPGLTYSWAVSPAVSGFSSTSAAATFTAPQPTTATTYTLTLTATSGTQCSTTDQVRITVLPAVSPSLAIQASATTILAGQSVTLSVPNPQAGATYAWTGPGLQATTGPSVTATPAAGTSAAQYRVTATLGTCSRTAQVLVAVAVPGTPAWTWARRSGSSSDDRTTASATDAAGNTYVTGYFQDSTRVGSIKLYSQGSADIFVAKYDPAGAVLWAQRFGGTGYDRGLAIAVSPQGNVFLSGAFGNTMQVGSTLLTAQASLELFVARLDATTGAPGWALANTGTPGAGGGNLLQSLATTAAGDVLACGQFSGALSLGGLQLTGGNNASWLVACLTETGTVKWVRDVGNGSNPATANSIACDDQGNAYVAGTAQGPFTFGASTVPAGTASVYLTYFSSQGQPQWLRALPGATTNTIPPQLAVDAAGSAYVACGSSAAGVTFTGASAADNRAVTATGPAPGYAESYLACYSPAGNPAWARNLATYSAAATSIASAAVVRGGFLYVGGWFTGSTTFGTLTLPSTTAGYSAFVAKYSLATGQNSWAQQSALDPCAVRGMGVDAAGNCYIAGDFGPTIAFGTDLLTSAGSTDGFVAKLGTSILLATQPAAAPTAPEWQLYPNPSGEQEALHVQLPTPVTVQEYSLYSAVGQLVQHRPVGATLQSLEIAPGLPPGVYLLRLQTAAGVLSRQFVRQ